MNVQLPVEDINTDYDSSYDSVDAILDKHHDDEVIKSKKAARQQVERRREMKELDRQLDAYYDTLLD